MSDVIEQLHAAAADALIELAQEKPPEKPKPEPMPHEVVRAWTYAWVDGQHIRVPLNADERKAFLEQRAVRLAEEKVKADEKAAKVEARRKQMAEQAEIEAAANPPPFRSPN